MAAAAVLMRIGMQTWGSEGDIRPFLALGGGLARAGHDVTLVITEVDDRDYRRYADLLGIRIEMVASPVLSSDADRQRLGEELLAMGNPLRQGLAIAREAFEPCADAMFAAAKTLAADSDLLVRHFFHYPAATAAAAVGVPDVSVSFSPDAIPSREYPPAAMANLGTAVNRVIWAAGIFLLDRLLLPPANRFRSARGVARAPTITDSWYSERLNVLAVSPSIRPRAADWPDRHRVSGFLTLADAGRADPVPAAVTAFLDEGPPPVFIGFGSLTPRDAGNRDDTLEIVSDALRLAGCRGIVQGLAPQPHRDGDVLYVDRLPHAEVFPRCAAVVHHCGAGTTQTALACGVPSIGVPHLADQFYWSAQLHRLGVAPAPLRRTRLSGAALARRIDAATSTQAMCQRAAALGQALAAEDGVGAAVTFIEQVCGGTAR